MYEKSFMENIAEQTLNGAKSDEKSKVMTRIHESQSKNLKTKLMEYVSHTPRVVPPRHW